MLFQKTKREKIILDQTKNLKSQKVYIQTYKEVYQELSRYEL